VCGAKIILIIERMEFSKVLGRMHLSISFSRIFAKNESKFIGWKEVQIKWFIRFGN